MEVGKFNIVRLITAKQNGVSKTSLTLSPTKWAKFAPPSSIILIDNLELVVNRVNELKIS